MDISEVYPWLLWGLAAVGIGYVLYLFVKGFISGMK